MHNIMVAGAGRMGRLIAYLLADSGDYQVYLVDLEVKEKGILQLVKVMPSVHTLALDVTHQGALQAALKKYSIHAVISSLPYYMNAQVAKVAKIAKVHYFDLTEDTSTTKTIATLAEDAKIAFVPQCGLAPGFVGIAANSLMQEFDLCHHVKLRVGALPQYSSNPLHYALNWSTDGLINEYVNPCYAIADEQAVQVSPLEGLETLEIDGCVYEAFNTSGGIGSLGVLSLGKVQSLNYKTLRYPGHCEKMRLLMHTLRLKDDRETLKYILERALPKTNQDVVIIYISVEGIKHKEKIEKSYVKKIYPVCLRDIEWSAIQISTASGVCAVVDLVLTEIHKYNGLILQEKFSLKQVLNNRFGRYFA